MISLKILFISYNGLTEPLLHSQGIPYMRELSRKGFEFTFLTFEKNQRSGKQENRTISEVRKNLEEFNIDWHYLTYHKSPRLLATLFDIFCGTIYSLYLLKKKNIQIIHARSTVPCAMAFVVSKICRIKFIFDIRGLMAQEYVDANLWKRNSFVYKLVDYFDKKFLLSADYVLVLTERIRDIIKNNGYVKLNRDLNIQVIPSCVDLERFRPSDNNEISLKRILGLEDKFILLYLGSLGTWYMLEEMLDFFLVFKKMISNAHFLIITHSDKEIVRQAAEDKGLKKYDFTISEFSPLDIHKFINQCDVGIFFIKPVFSKYSSSPTKLGEYLSSGLPVVINSNIGDSDRIVKDTKTGVVINRFKAEEYKKSIENLLELLKEKDQIKLRCRQAAREYLSLSTAVNRYEEIYRYLENQI